MTKYSINHKISRTAAKMPAPTMRATTTMGPFYDLWTDELTKGACATWEIPTERGWATKCVSELSWVEWSLCLGESTPLADGGDEGDNVAKWPNGTAATKTTNGPNAFIDLLLWLWLCLCTTCYVSQLIDLWKAKVTSCPE